LDADGPNVRVIRIQRQDSVNRVRELDPQKVREIWKDPLLRYSNVLDGLFHDAVVLCESDSDCRFYAAVMDAIREANPDQLRPDIMFTHCGGKTRLPMVVRALQALDVKIRVVTDFDVLNSDQPLRGVYEALGGLWSEIQKDWCGVKESIEQKKPELNADEVRKDIESILSRTTGSCFPSSAADEIRQVLNRSSPWSMAKSVGKSFVPSGDPTQKCDRLLSTLSAKGLHVVEHGELEGFDKSVGGHGPAWVNSVLAKNLLTDAHLEPARLFVKGII
jgi:hypothetical protein